MPVGCFGITRIARVTGLDRSGVEVACAIRPSGHILQIANGKGLTFAQAARRAESEAAELWAAETVHPELLRWSSWSELMDKGIEALHPLGLGSANGKVEDPLWSASLRLAWSPAKNLFDGRGVRVPSQALHCLRQNDWALGPQVVRWTTNGMGAHPRRSAALVHALLEAIERDQLSRSLVNGWTAQAISSRMLAPSSVGSPTAAWLSSLRKRGFLPFLFDLTPPHGLGLPIAGALLFDEEDGPIPVTAGYACHLSPNQALLAALLEAAQSRLTDVHGAREDVGPMDRTDADWLRQRCLAARPRRGLSDMPWVRAKNPLQAVRRCLWKHGHRDAVVADLAPASSPLRVVKAVVPGFEVSELL